MVNTSKILTVSYGTFSCTLEGFDDSFDTMKAIAEYFRDLAADDRYFGAEPPTPDAEMLARIAEKEISRRVEAREESGSIVLRPTLAAPTAAAAAAVSSIEEAVESDAEPVSEASGEAPEAEKPQDTPDIEESVLAAISADALVNQEEDAEPEPAETETTPDTDTRAVLDQVSDVVDPEPEAVEQDVAILPDVPADADQDADDAQESQIMQSNATVSEADRDSIAAKLQRIRSVVSSEPQTEPEAEEDEVAGATLDLIGEDVAAVAEEVEEVAVEAEEPEIEEQEEPAAELPEETTVSVSEEEDRADEDWAEEDWAEEDWTEEDSDVTEDLQQETPYSLRARVMKVKRADLDAAATDAGDIKTDQTGKTGGLSDEEEAELQRELAEVEAEMSGGADAAYNDEFDDEQDDEFEGEDSLIAEDGDESQFDDASGENMFEDEAPQHTLAAARRVVRQSSDAHVRLTTESVEEGQEVNRLLDETNSQLDEPEGNRRRNAIAHLRKAVMATKAEKSHSKPEVKADPETAYREDLASVVRPRRPVGNMPRTERPADTRQAPLKLVAEQRVDLPERQAAAPVRPRRVSSRQVVEAPSGDTSGFAQFAQEMGATELPDLLEAAAAYMSFIEEREQFSRPQLMTKVRQVSKGDFSREDGLRVFGQLLRQGKIEKIRGGRFTVSDQIGYKPDNTRAAG